MVWMQLIFSDKIEIDEILKNVSLALNSRKYSKYTDSLKFICYNTICYVAVLDHVHIL